MRILFLCFVVPYPVNRGDKRRIMSLLRSLADRHSVTLLCISRDEPDGETLEQLHRYCDSVHVVLLHGYRRRLNQIVNLLSRRPLRVSSYRSRAVARTVTKTCRETEFDMVFACDIRMAPYALQLGHACTILDFVDAYSIYYDRAANVERNILLKLVFTIESLRMKSYERMVAREFTTCLVSSSLDQRALLSTSSNGLNIQVIPNTIDTRSFEHSNGELESRSMAFVGYMGHKNNIDAVVHFCCHIFPWIADRVRDARFYIIGDNPSPEVRRLASDNSNIIVTGRIANLVEFLAKCDVFVCPLRMGAGTRIKLLEAMAVGVPIVTSPLGCEGLDVTHGIQMLIADDDRAFAEAAIRLFQDRSLRRSLVKQAKRFVQQHHDIAIVGTHLDRILTSLRLDK